MTCKYKVAACNQYYLCKLGVTHVMNAAEGQRNGYRTQNMILYSLCGYMWWGYFSFLVSKQGTRKVQDVRNTGLLKYQIKYSTHL